MALLHARRRRRMIRGNDVETLVLQALPQLLPIAGRADWRGALVPHISIRNVFSSKVEIVHTCLHCNGQLLRLGCLYHGEGIAVGKVSDVKIEAQAGAGNCWCAVSAHILTQSIKQATDAVPLPFRRARGHVRCIRGRFSLNMQVVIHQLSMHHDGDAQLPQCRESSRHVADARVGEIIDAAWADESLESNHTALCHGSQYLWIMRIIRDKTSPEGNVCVELALGCRHLPLQLCNCCHGRGAIQGHVDQKSDSTGCSRPSPGNKAFPLDSAGLI
mmetsp:Transcript_13490/g.34616  ORF Transcript_13490/g.34616 Transcript_13490/m.34616 type:complete len:274 (-) Transcript_13490:572-1393(-)